MNAPSELSILNAQSAKYYIVTHPLSRTARVVTEDFPTDRFTAVIVYSSGDSAVEMAGSIARRAACPVHAISQAAIDAVVCETRSRWAEKSGTKGAKVRM